MYATAARSADIRSLKFSAFEQKSDEYSVLVQNSKVKHPKVYLIYPQLYLDI
jgi:hypothetical protein